MIFFSNEMGQMTKMAAMPFYGTNASKGFYSGTNASIIIVLGMLHSGLMSLMMYSNND